MKVPIRLTLCFLAVLVATAHAAPPKGSVAPVAVDGPSELSVGDVASFRVTGEITSVDWGTMPEVDGIQLADGGLTLFIPTRPGVLKITVIAAVGLEDGVKLLMFPVTIGPQPEPDPWPEPDPNPYSAPTGEQRSWVLPIRDFLLSQSTDPHDLARLAALYSVVAEGAVDGESAGAIRSRLLAVAKEMLRGERLGPEGLAIVIETAMVGLLGTSNVPIVATKSTTALTAVAWSIHEGGGR